MTPAMFARCKPAASGAPSGVTDGPGAWACVPFPRCCVADGTIRLPGQAIRQRIPHSRTVAGACDPQLRDRPAERSRALLDGEHGCADREVHDFGHRYSVIDRNELLPQRLPERVMALTRQANGSDHWPRRRFLSGWRTGRAGGCASHGAAAADRPCGVAQIALHGSCCSRRLSI